MDAALVYVLAILAGPVLWALGLGAIELLQMVQKRRAARRQAAPGTTVAEIIERIDAERFTQEVQRGESPRPVRHTTGVEHVARADAAGQNAPARPQRGRHAAQRGHEYRARYWPTCDHDGDFVTDELPRTASPRASTSRTHDHHQPSERCAWRLEGGPA